MWSVCRAGSRSRPGLVSAVMAAAAAAALLAGCGSSTVSAERPGASGSPAPAVRPSGPPGGSRAQALALARHLLALLVLPSGARHLQGPVPRQLRQPGVGLGALTLADVHQFDALGLPPQTASRFFGAHVPSGMRFISNGQAGGPSGVMALDVGYAPRSLPPGIYRAELDLTLVPAAGGSLVRADAQVIWYLARSAAEYLTPADFAALTVRAVILTPKHHAVTRQITSSKVIARLAGLLNGLPAAPRLVMSCPAMLTIYRVRFAAKASGGPGVAATSGSCFTDQVWVGGRAQPSLMDANGRLAAAVRHLLGLKQAP